MTQKKEPTIEPVRSKSLLDVLATLAPLDEAFPPVPDLPIDLIET